jgi:hypothetical protein
MSEREDDVTSMHSFLGGKQLLFWSRMVALGAETWQFRALKPTDQISHPPEGHCQCDTRSGTHQMVGSPVLRRNSCESARRWWLSQGCTAQVSQKLRELGVGIRP